MVARAFKFTNLPLEQRRKWFGLFIPLPAVVTIFSTIFYPLLLGIVSSFQQVRLTNLGDTPWIGLDNYVKLFNDRYFWNALRNTAIFTTVWTFGAAFIGLLAAVLLNRETRAKERYDAARRKLLGLPDTGAEADGFAIPPGPSAR